MMVLQKKLNFISFRRAIASAAFG